MENLELFDQIMFVISFIIIFLLIKVLIGINNNHKTLYNIERNLGETQNVVNALYRFKEVIYGIYDNSKDIKDKLDNSLGEKGERELDDFSNKIDEIIKILKSRSRAKKTTKAINKDK